MIKTSYPGKLEIEKTGEPCCYKCRPASTRPRLSGSIRVPGPALSTDESYKIKVLCTRELITIIVLLSN